MSAGRHLEFVIFKINTFYVQFYDYQLNQIYCQNKTNLVLTSQTVKKL